MACVLANAPIDTLIITGLPEEAMATIDVGESRTAAQHIAFRDTQVDSNRRYKWQSITVGLMRWEDRAPCDFLNTGVSVRANVPAAVEDEYFRMREEIEAALPTVAMLRNEALLSPKNSGVLRVLFGRVDPAAADAFLSH
jgi:hypothetical protein